MRPCFFRFQSTPPVWGVTELEIVGYVLPMFQSTPPVWGVTGRV